MNSLQATPVTFEALRDQVAASMPELQAVLENLVRIPSVSAEAFDQSHIVAGAEFVAELFREVGFPEVQILRAPKDSDGLAAPGGRAYGAPAVVAKKPAPDGAPTVLLYAHFDAQPPGEGWNTDPFEPVVKDGRLYGRAAADDKAGVVANYGAVKALNALGALPDIGIVVFIEGEEEIGSPTFEAFLAENRELLSADVIFVPDAANWQVGIPALTTSLRGLIDGTVEVSVLESGIHSGLFGGPILDANVLLARLIATLHDDAGDVAVAGLVEAEAPVVDYEVADFRRDAGLLTDTELTGTGSLSARLWTKPAISVIGLDATSIAHSANVLAPSAKAKISMRIPPGQDPAAASVALEKHLLAKAPFGAKVTWELNEAGTPYQTPSDSPAMQMARRAFSQGWQVDSVDIGMGGSIPFIALLARDFPQAQLIITGVADPASQIHGPNESVALEALEKVVLSEALLLLEIAKGFPGSV
jgi:acetylornithine deacetylase/succinyl-diaminopimelate desuccinylase-like protein